MRGLNRLGATPIDGQQTNFVVWAPERSQIAIEIVAPVELRVELARTDDGYFQGTAPVGAGARYFVVPDNGEGRPDPASRFQPEGVHGPSEVIDPDFSWTDADWQGVHLPDYIIYELHVGTFSEAGTFDGVIAHLDELVQLGITAIELMPVAQFPGARNWGYDGVQPFAVQNSYGGPAGLKRLVDAAHARGLAVILDVVYNHMGPEGNYLGEFGPYFTDKYRTPWGWAVNVDHEHSDDVRRYFIDNAVEWLDDYHIDALRLDAVHGIVDTSARPFLAELSDRVATHFENSERPVYLIAESDLNDVRMITSTAHSGMGMHAQWTDDFHHALHALLTREDSGYYMDFGSVEDFARSLTDAYVFSGQYSEYRKRRHGNSTAGFADAHFVVCIQNHDQVGNRMNGERLSALADFERQKLGAAAVLLSPFVPLLFMGEEYAEERPFQYFIDHSDEELIAAVREGRKREFAAFAWQGEPPDPYAVTTYEKARMSRATDGQHGTMRKLYHHLIELRAKHGLGPNATLTRGLAQAYPQQEAVTFERGDALVLYCFNEQPQQVEIAVPNGSWQKVFATSDPQWGGPGDQLPEQLAGGTATLQLPASAAALYTRTSQE